MNFTTTPVLPRRLEVILGEDISNEEYYGTLFFRSKLRITPSVEKRIEKNRLWLERETKRKRIYGVNTGFGALINVEVEDLESLQENLIVSHAVSVGPSFPPWTIRGALLLRVHSLARAKSGVRVALIKKLLQTVEEGWIPEVGKFGSVGASGDLAPLSTLFGRVLGLVPGVFEGWKWNGEEWERSRFQQMEKFPLHSKEGLALNNGIQFTLAHFSVSLWKLLHVFVLNVFSYLLSLEAGRSTLKHLDENALNQRASVCARQLQDFIKTLIEDLPSNQEVLQDAYSMRCGHIPLSNVYQTLADAFALLNNEINSISDNPLILNDEGKVISTCNFHCDPIGVVSDFLKIVIAKAASVSERRIFRLLDERSSRGLPPFLASNPGVESGFMISQYLAAALVSRLKGLAHPYSADSIPTSAGQEDYVSMAPNSVDALYEAVDGYFTVVAVEVLASLYGIKMRGGPCSSVASLFYEGFSRKVGFKNGDHHVGHEVESTREWLSSPDFWESLFERFPEVREFMAELLKGREDRW